MGKKGGGSRRAVMAAQRAKNAGSEDDEPSTTAQESQAPESVATNEKPANKAVDPSAKFLADPSPSAKAPGAGGDNADENDEETGAGGAFDGTETRGHMLQRHKQELRCGNLHGSSSRQRPNLRVGND